MIHENKEPSTPKPDFVPQPQRKSEIGSVTVP
jgi:hypothetical protein